MELKELSAFPQRSIRSHQEKESKEQCACEFACRSSMFPLMAWLSYPTRHVMTKQVVRERSSLLMQLWPLVVFKVDFTTSYLFLKASWFINGYRINSRLEPCSTCQSLSMNSLAIESFAFPSVGWWSGMLWDVSVESFWIHTASWMLCKHNG